MRVAAMASTLVLSTSLFAQTAPAPSASATYEELIATARTLVKAGNASAALGASQRAASLDDRRWEAFLAAASAYSKQSLYDDAVGMLQAALVRAPEDRKPLIRDAIDEARRALSAALPPPPLQSVVAPPASPRPLTQAEIVVWKSIENSKNAADFQGYLDAYPNGPYAALAKRRLSAIAEAGRVVKVGQVTEVQSPYQYVVFDLSPGTNVAVGETVLVGLGGDAMLEMTVQRRHNDSASATTRGTIKGVNVGAIVFRRAGSAR